MRCPACGYGQGFGERCLRCGLPLFEADLEIVSFEIHDISDLFAALAGDDESDDFGGGDDFDASQPAPLPIDEAEAMALVHRIFSDASPLELTMPIAAVWILLSAAQVAYRHPHISDDQKTMIFEAGAMIAARIIERHPDAAELINIGWDESNDR